MPKSPCLKIPKTSGQKAIETARHLRIYNPNIGIEQEDGFLYIPLLREPTEKEKTVLAIATLKEEYGTHDFSMMISKPKSYVDLLAEALPPHLVASLPRSADFVGDIAVIEILSELDKYKRQIGEALLTTHKHVRTVLAKASAVGGAFRTRKFEIIAGEPKTITLHKENGCVFRVDLAKAFFSPRLSTEHARVARLINEGETVLDMFAGVGPFAVQIARQCTRVRVIAVDANPDAVELLKRNITANRVLAMVKPFLGDARQVVQTCFVGVADRVIMNLPESATEYLDVACEALKPTGGIMHYYAFTRASEPKEAAKVRLVEAVKEAHRKVEEILEIRTVRATAPYEWQIVIDARIS